MSQNPCNLPGPATENILHVVLNASTASAQSRMKQWPTWRQVCGKFHIHIHRVACQCLRELLERGMVQQVAKNHTHCGSEAAASPVPPLPARPSKAAGGQWHVRVHASDLQLTFNKASWIAADTAVVEQWFRQDGGNLAFRLQKVFHTETWMPCFKEWSTGLQLETPALQNVLPTTLVQQIVPETLGCDSNTWSMLRAAVIWGGLMTA